MNLRGAIAIWQLTHLINDMHLVNCFSWHSFSNSVGYRVHTQRIDDAGIDRHKFVGSYVELHKTLHRLLMEFTMISNAINMGKPTSYIKRQE